MKVREYNICKKNFSGDCCNWLKPLYQVRYQPSGSPVGSTLRVIPGLILDNQQFTSSSVGLILYLSTRVRSSHFFPSSLWINIHFGNYSFAMHVDVIVDKT